MPPRRSTRAARPPTVSVQVPSTRMPRASATPSALARPGSVGAFCSDTPPKPPASRPRAAWARRHHRSGGAVLVAEEGGAGGTVRAGDLEQDDAVRARWRPAAAALGGVAAVATYQTAERDQRERQERGEHDPQAVVALPGFVPGERARAERGDAGRQDGGVPCRRERPARGRGGRWSKCEGRTGGDRRRRQRRHRPASESGRVRAGQGARVRAGGTSRRRPGQRAGPEGWGRSRPRNPPSTCGIRGTTSERPCLPVTRPPRARGGREHAC